MQGGTKADLTQSHCRRRRAFARSFGIALATIGTVLHYVLLLLTRGVIGGLAQLAFDVGDRVIGALRKQLAFS